MTETTTTTAESSYDLVPPDPESMNVEAVESHLADRDCTDLRDLSTSCPEDESKISSSISEKISDLIDEPIEFSIENDSDDRFVFNPYSWLLQKWDGSGWRRIAPFTIPAPIHELASGDSHEWRLAVDNVAFGGLDGYKQRKDVTLSGVGPGVYGFSVPGYFESEPDDEFAAGAIFGFAGTGPPVRPTEDVVRVERDGHELLVHGPRAGEGGGSSSREFVATLVGGEPDARLLPEHVLQVRGLRNTLPYVATDGVRSIRYLGDPGQAHSYLLAVSPDDATRFGFRDVTFKVE